MPKAVGGLDNQNQRLRGVALPTAATDAVPKSFIRYDLSATCIGLPAAGEVLAGWIIPADLTAGLILPANMINSVIRAMTAANASAAFTLTRTPIGSSAEATLATMTFAAGATSPTYSTQASQTINASDLLRLRCPATQDTTLADIFFSIVFAR